MPKLSDAITDTTKGDWKIWTEETYMDVIGVFYPYFTSDYTISHRIRDEPVFTKDEYIKKSESDLLNLKKDRLDVEDAHFNQIRTTLKKMSILAEDWDESDFLFRDSMNFHNLPKNNAALLNKLEFPFEEYKANQRLACYVYQKMGKACLNQYGVYGSYKNSACNEAMTMFSGCVQNHQQMAMVKKYWPEKFAANPMSYPTPDKSDI